MGKKSTSKSSKAKAKAANKSNTDAAMDQDFEATGDQEKTLQQNPDEDSDDGLPRIKRRHVPNEQLSPEEEQSLVEWFSEHPLFFDQTEADFKNKGKKERLLAEKGQ